ncbi:MULTISPECIES: type I glyceraldehyde-3-phosphate dehydrogenase [unclassified Microbacterium]|uniref:type I glyceraldehyde-3-phosphate dehydrogenase n=1 Tax=unclassified Microbacterium TaxID=2609290 RepID=UPI0004930FEE|nr:MULTISPECIES: glyceraldehyde 3-phosphate dehydrogenase NAD-binding domain-containing protein [unclassified Microbacterium]MCV0334015.1 type I glyceraldehyde-3-phosphate dehydrogenase [Microbacterium sp.]MCV0374457.1 type I glyceraldehyde-3-phosphate dehydrogenase [Microbacterium sp.]MCV0389529.1 type I glyceraldehyde-3-phosphate dehydrogenase [Microbacterium sp.]MCV0419063.1 type I glyceraldehyde-3-phosphate dehydrogenase [Microbacterium sp.]MCV0421369.1 type I glyceraldehyde-3-phosphate de
MPTRIAVNGLGRIGRNQLRLLLARRSELELVAVNDPRGPRALAELLQRDGHSGPSTRGVRFDDKHLFLNGHAIRMFTERDPLRLPWAALGIDIVIESTGAETRSDDARKHLTAGARKVIMTVPTAGDDGTFMRGVNEHTYDPTRHHVISSASCTTNCLAPVAKVFHEAFGIDAGLMTTIHADSTDLLLQDIPHSDPRSAGGKGTKISAGDTGAALAIGRVIPELEGRLDGFALRVPAISGSITHLTVTASRPVTVDEVRAAYETAADGPLKGILRCADDEIAIADTVIDPHSSILDAGLIRVIGSQVKISAWYDDEWGYSHRLTELAEYVAERLPA